MRKYVVLQRLTNPATGFKWWAACNPHLEYAMLDDALGAASHLGTTVPVGSVFGVAVVEHVITVDRLVQVDKYETFSNE